MSFASKDSGNSPDQRFLFSLSSQSQNNHSSITRMPITSWHLLACFKRKNGRPHGQFDRCVRWPIWSATKIQESVFAICPVRTFSTCQVAVFRIFVVPFDPAFAEPCWIKSYHAREHGRSVSTLKGRHQGQSVRLVVWLSFCRSHRYKWPGSRSIWSYKALLIRLQVRLCPQH